MATTISEGQAGRSGRRDVLNVTVRYAAALKPFHDHDADRDETLASLKARVLTEFGLTEGETTPDGSTLLYKLYFHKEEQTDLGRTLGALAGQADALELKLSQYIQQGS